MGRKSSQTVMKLKQVAVDKKQRMSGNVQIKIQKIIMNQLAKDTLLNKVFKLVLRFLKAILEIP